MRSNHFLIARAADGRIYLIADGDLARFERPDLARDPGTLAFLRQNNVHGNIKEVVYVTDAVRRADIGGHDFPDKRARK